MKGSLKKRIAIIGVLLFLILIGIELQDNYRKHGDFRTMQDSISSVEPVDLDGLRELHFAGGPLIPLPALKKQLNFVKEKIIIVDGVQGKYGYINGTPDNYLEYTAKSPSWRAYIWRLFYTGTIKSYPEFIISGAEAAKSYGFDYRSFRIGSKYLSKDEDIDKFISFFDSLPKNVYLYFHCLHGKGRTSMMLVMADIIKNAPKVSLADIIKRQHLLGSVDLFDTASWIRGSYSPLALETRKKFIESFYEFICQRKAGGIQLWSDWNHQNKEK